MPTREEMLQTIYDKIADKTLKEWSYIDWFWHSMWFVCNVKPDEIRIVHWGYRMDRHTRLEVESFIGLEVYNPVMIGDVLDWMEKKWVYPAWWLWDTEDERRFIEECGSIVFYRKDKRKPIDEQECELIEYVYSLITEQCHQSE